jgi:hypothetical protein
LHPKILSLCLWESPISVIEYLCVGANVGQSVHQPAKNGESHKYEQQPEYTSEETGDHSANEGEQEANQDQNQYDVHDAAPPILIDASVIVVVGSRTVR